MERLLDSANPELARLSDAISARYLARIERHNIEARVRTVLTRRLQQSEPTQEEVAEILNVSARTLQRKLGDCGTSFKEILDETRHALALAYLSEPHQPRRDHSPVGILLQQRLHGRLRRWTGRSPTDWRTGNARCPSPGRRLHAATLGTHAAASAAGTMAPVKGANH